MAAVAPGIVDLLTWIGLNTARKCTGVEDDLLSPNGLVHLKDETADGIIAACNGYTKRQTAARFTITRVQQKRIISLMYWVQDRHRTREAFAFDVGTDQAMFLDAISEASERHEARKSQKRIGETFLGKDFAIQLKSRHQWERWLRELKDTLSSIIGVSGVPLTYVIRYVTAPTLVGHTTWEEKVVAATPVTGRDFIQDSKTVHTIILKNLSEDSEAYTYIEAKLVQQNGRIDIKSLKDRYANAAADDVLGNEAKGTMKNLVYKNERAMTFEKFQEKFKKAINDLDKAGRPLNPADIIDEIWRKIQHPGLSEFIADLEVQQTFNPLTYDQILQSIAIHIPKVANFNNTHRNVSEINSKFTRDGSCPDEGAHAADGSLFIGTYHKNKWHSTSVRPYQQEIIKARGASPHPTRKNKKFQNEKKRSIRKIQKLTRQVKALESQKRKVSEVHVQAEEIDEVEETQTETQAGTSFGGKKSRVKLNAA